VNHPKAASICAVVVTFHPDVGFPERAARIAGQVGRMVIVDNGSEAGAVRMLEETAARFGARLILNGGNLGIAAALNQGVDWARERGFDWAILLDQDSTPDEDMAPCLLAVYHDYPYKERLAVLGSNFREVRERPSASRSPGMEVSWMDQPMVITSGSLISIAAWAEIGGFRTDYFIDDVDNEYCVRAQCRGFTTIVSRRPLMRHAIGAATRHRLAWHVTKTTNHAPMRRYYMTRNRIVLVKTYLTRRPARMLRLLHSYLKNVVLMLLFERQRGEKLRWAVLGAWHGLLGRMGGLR